MMQQKYSIVIADTSCFILLDKINELHLLQQVFGTVVTTENIAAEYRKEIPSWVRVAQVTNKEYQLFLLLQVDNGEASAIALAVEMQSALLIIDDNKARKLAARLHLAYTGTLGVLLKAKQLGVILFIKPVLQKIQETNFRFSKRSFDEILLLA